MKQEDLARISALSQKSRAQSLTAEEKAEQASLRSQYIAEMRASLRGQLDQMYVLDENGNEVPVKVSNEEKTKKEQI